MTAPELFTQIQGQGTVSADNLNTYEQTCDNTTQLRAYIGTQGIQVFLRGTYTPGDGGQGVFYWNSTSLSTDDNGVTAVVPQPGVPGAWLRINLSFGSFERVVVLSASSTLVSSEFNSIFELVGSTPFTTTLPATSTIGISNSLIWNMTSVTQTFIGTTNFIGPNGSGTTNQPIAANQIMTLTTDGTNLIVQGPFPSQLILTQLIQSGSTIYAVDTGTANNYVIALNPPITSYTDGQKLSFRPINNNTGPSFLNAGGGSIEIVGPAGGLQGGEIDIGYIVTVQYSSLTSFFNLIDGMIATQVGQALNSDQAPQWGQVLAGYNTSYINVLALRAIGVTYTNTYGKPIAVAVSAQISAAGFVMFAFVSGQFVATSGAAGSNGYTVSLYFIVPTGGNYSIQEEPGSTATPQYWYELR
jgi:hypothetical protein